MIAMQMSSIQRVNKTKREFDALPGAKKLLRQMETSAEKAEKMLAERPYKMKPKFEKKVKLHLLGNATGYLLYLKALKEFAATKNASHRFLKHMDSLIDRAQERVVKIREMKL